MLIAGFVGDSTLMPLVLGEVLRLRSRGLGESALIPDPPAPPRAGLKPIPFWLGFCEGCGEKLIVVAVCITGEYGGEHVEGGRERGDRPRGGEEPD